MVTLSGLDGDIGVVERCALVSEPEKTEEPFTSPPIKWIVKECKMIKEMKKSYAYNLKVQNSTLNPSLYFFSILVKT